MKKNQIWIIIPAKDEERHIKSLLQDVATHTSNIVFVDDGSSDNTAELAREECEHVLSHPINIGKGAALKTGCEYAFTHLGANAVILMDSDEQHDHQDIPRFIKALNSAEMVLGERTMGSEMPFYKIFFNRLASLIVRILFGRYIPDIPSGYKAFTKNVYQDIRWKSTGYEVEMEIAVKLAKHKIPFEVLPIRTIYHDYYRGMTLLDVLSMLNRVVSWRLLG